MTESETVKIYITILFLQIENHSKDTDTVEATNEKNDLETTHACSSQGETPVKRRRKNPPELQEAGSLLKQAISSLDVALAKKDVPEDECDLYGKILAVKLKKLPELQRLQFMHEIDGMFLRYQPNLQTSTNSYMPSPASYYSMNRPDSVVSY